MLLWGGNVARGMKFDLGRQICSGVAICSGECQLLWGGNVALGRKCCSGE